MRASYFTHRERGCSAGGIGAVSLPAALSGRTTGDLTLHCLGCCCLTVRVVRWCKCEQQQNIYFPTLFLEKIFLILIF